MWKQIIFGIPFSACILFYLKIFLAQVWTKICGPLFLSLSLTCSRLVLTSNVKTMLFHFLPVFFSTWEFFVCFKSELNSNSVGFYYIFKTFREDGGVERNIEDLQWKIQLKYHVFKLFISSMVVKYMNSSSEIKISFWNLVLILTVWLKHCTFFLSLSLFLWRLGSNLIFWSHCVFLL